MSTIQSTNTPGGGPQKDPYLNRTLRIVFAIRRLMQAEELYTKELNKKYQVSTPQLNCLLTLYEYGSLPPSRIADYIMVKSSTITGIVDRLEQKGLVSRHRDSPDRRVITIELTEAGRKLAENAPPPIQQKIVEGLKRLSEDEVNQIVFGLTKLTDLLDVQDLVLE
ncbi:MAG: MarR family winged helix-turn-helix transcriptional regulator [Desulfatiglandales bacterium]